MSGAEIEFSIIQAMRQKPNLEISQGDLERFLESFQSFSETKTSEIQTARDQYRDQCFDSQTLEVETSPFSQ